MYEAEGDLIHAEKDLENGFYNWACFSAQQAAEKAIKAVFQKMSLVVWGHSIADLLSELSEKVEVPEKLVEHAYELDRVYITARYPDALPSGSPRERFSRTEAERMISYAREIIEFCKGILSEI
ncbi:MAG: HEPN domain-containing protein [Thermotogae bacterium]|nr:HEPN domain-containing protein [Thermotogota bacterium]